MTRKKSKKFESPMSCKKKAYREKETFYKEKKEHGKRVINFRTIQTS